MLTDISKTISAIVIIALIVGGMWSLGQKLTGTTPKCPLEICLPQDMQGSPEKEIASDPEKQRDALGHLLDPEAAEKAQLDWEERHQFKTIHKDKRNPSK